MKFVTSEELTAFKNEVMDRLDKIEAQMAGAKAKTTSKGKPDKGSDTEKAPQ